MITPNDPLITVVLYITTHHDLSRGNDMKVSSPYLYQTPNSNLVKAIVSKPIKQTFRAKLKTKSDNL